MPAWRLWLPSGRGGPSLAGMKAIPLLLLCALFPACAPWPPEAADLDRRAAGLEAPALLPLAELAVSEPASGP